MGRTEVIFTVSRDVCKDLGRKSYTKRTEYGQLTVSFSRGNRIRDVWTLYVNLLRVGRMMDNPRLATGNKRHSVSVS